MRRPCGNGVTLVGSYGRFTTVDRWSVVTLPKKSCECQKFALPGPTIGSCAARRVSGQ